MSEYEPLIREVIQSCGNKARLAEYARKRHGFGNSDGGFGVTYPTDAQEFEEGVIPEGSVEIYGHWGPPEGYEVLVEEVEYLRVLAQVLRERGLDQEALDVERLRPTNGTDGAFGSATLR